MSKEADDESRLPEKRLALPPEEQVRDLLNVEKQRIIRDNRRAAVAEKALEVADASDRRSSLTETDGCRIHHHGGSRHRRAPSSARRLVNGGVTELLGRVVRSRLRLPRPRRWVGS